MTEVEHEMIGTVGIVRLCAPERRNALTPEMARDFCHALDELEAQGELTAVVVAGSGGSFCAGATRELLARVGESPASDDSVREIGAVYRMFSRLAEVQVPTVAAVAGAAVGAGLNLALSADVRVVGFGSRLMSGFLQIGVHPGGGHFSLLSRVAGRSTATAMTFCGQDILGEDAVTRGLAWSVVPDDDVENAALKLAQNVSGDAQLVRTAYAMFDRLASSAPLDPVSAVEAERGAQMWSLARRAARS